jgi:hypothetical protein
VSQGVPRCLISAAARPAPRKMTFESRGRTRCARRRGVLARIAASRRMAREGRSLAFRSKMRGPRHVMASHSCRR